MTSNTSPAIELRGAGKAFRTPSGTLHTAVRDLDLTVDRGEFVAVVGPTGCGKSTTPTLVSGLEEPTEGEVLVGGAPVRGIGSEIGFVFQQDAVFPWRTVLSNVMAGPRFRGVPKAEARERARDWLERVGLTAFEDRYTHQLSGGQRKRVALAATFVNDPAILLMDEPFSALFRAPARSTATSSPTPASWGRATAASPSRWSFPRPPRGSSPASTSASASP
jgi:sulfonate transport system ATP-binding protein